MLILRNVPIFPGSGNIAPERLLLWCFTVTTVKALGMRMGSNRPSPFQVEKLKQEVGKRNSWQRKARDKFVDSKRMKDLERQVWHTGIH